MCGLFRAVFISFLLLETQYCDVWYKNISFRAEKLHSACHKNQKSIVQESNTQKYLVTLILITCQSSHSISVSFNFVINITIKKSWLVHNIFMSLLSTTKLPALEWFVWRWHLILVCQFSSSAYWSDIPVLVPEFVPTGFSLDVTAMIDNDNSVAGKSRLSFPTLRGSLIFLLKHLSARARILNCWIWFANHTPIASQVFCYTDHNLEFFPTVTILANSKSYRNVCKQPQINQVFCQTIWMLSDKLQIFVFDFKRNHCNIQ